MTTPITNGPTDLAALLNHPVLGPQLAKLLAKAQNKGKFEIKKATTANGKVGMLVSTGHGKPQFLYKAGAIAILANKAAFEAFFAANPDLS